MKIVKMHFIKCWALLLSLLLVGTAQAGIARVGNGGGIVSCSENPGDYVLYDFAAASMDKDWELQVFPAGATREDILNQVFHNLSRLDPNLGYAVSEFVFSIKTNANWVSADQIDQITYPDPLPLGCRFIQVANFAHRLYFPEFFNEGSFGPPLPLQIHADLWDRLDPLNQAGLLIHEALYPANPGFAWPGHDPREIAVSVRKTTAFVFSQAAAHATPEQFQKFLRDVGYSQHFYEIFESEPTFEIDGLEITLPDSKSTREESH